jgi:hypothetical protein
LNALVVDTAHSIEAEVGERGLEPAPDPRRRRQERARRELGVVVPAEVLVGEQHARGEHRVSARVGLDVVERLGPEARATVLDGKPCGHRLEHLGEVLTDDL